MCKMIQKGFVFIFFMSTPLFAMPEVPEYYNVKRCLIEKKGLAPLLFENQEALYREVFMSYLWIRWALKSKYQPVEGIKKCEGVYAGKIRLESPLTIIAFIHAAIQKSSRMKTEISHMAIAYYLPKSVSEIEKDIDRIFNIKIPQELIQKSLQECDAVHRSGLLTVFSRDVLPTDEALWSTFQIQELISDELEIRCLYQMNASLLEEKVDPFLPLVPFIPFSIEDILEHPHVVSQVRGYYHMYEHLPYLDRFIAEHHRQDYYFILFQEYKKVCLFLKASPVAKQYPLLMSSLLKTVTFYWNKMTLVQKNAYTLSCISSSCQSLKDSMFSSFKGWIGVSESL